MNGNRAQSSLDLMAEHRLAALDECALRRRLSPTARAADGVAARDGAVLTSFCCNDYLGLSQHPSVKQAAHEALEVFGAGAGASRLVTGNHPLYDDLERRLAAIKGTEAALVFGSGYLANLAIPPALTGSGDLILADELVHASMHAGIRASRADALFFTHNDIEDCHRILKAERLKFRHCLIMTEGVFSMDGDLAPLEALCDLAEAHDGWMMTDDAHGLGVLGGGWGSAAQAGVGHRVPLQMGTLSKAVGSYGGYLCASRPVIDLMVNRARSLIYATGLPPATVAASSAALELIGNDAALVAAPMEKARRFCQAVGLPDPQSPIVPLITGDASRALDASAALATKGFLVIAIRPPTVPEGTARLRFTFQETHRDEDIDRLAAAVREIGLVG
jgi:8-amino-7-oxononanoate synthase